MSLDVEMAEIAKVFFQESREGLDVMESGLLNLGISADSENINTIFRAAHSIKGGSATFGFAEVADFTHGLETLLDEMRNGMRQVTPEAIQTMLQACDCLREMIAATETEQPLDRGRIAGLEHDIMQILGEAPDGVIVAAPEPLRAGAGSATAPLDYAGWRIDFEPVANLLNSPHWVRLSHTPTYPDCRRSRQWILRRATSRGVSRLSARFRVQNSTKYLIGWIRTVGLNWCP
jgi:two-component system chemotaxis sensor kinase CheA